MAMMKRRNRLLLCTISLLATILCCDASLLSSHDNTRASIDPTCDACAFDGNDKDSCVVYGSLPHLDELIAWHKAPQNCLDHYNVHLQSVSLDSLREIWPRGYMEEPVLEKLMHFLEQTVVQPYQNTVHNIILNVLRDFFEEVPGGGILAFHSRISVGVTQYDCAALEGDCWTALRKYFGQTDDGRRHAIKLGQRLFKESHYEQEQEQRNVRQMICTDVHGASETGTEKAQSLCGSLADQVHDYWRGNTELSCQVFGEGVPEELKDAMPHHCVLDDGGGQVVSGHLDPTKSGGSKSYSSGLSLLSVTVLLSLSSSFGLLCL